MKGATRSLAGQSESARRVLLDLFPLLHGNLHGTGGNWTWKGDVLSVSGDRPRLELDCQPRGSYRYHLEFTIHQGTKVALLVPIDDDDVTVVLGGWAGKRRSTSPSTKERP